MIKKRSEKMLTPEQRAGQLALHSYFQAGIGRQKKIAAASGIFASTLSSMAHGRMPITLEAAILIEVASGGAVLAEALCPGRADVLKTMMRERARRV